MLSHLLVHLCQKIIQDAVFVDLVGDLRQLEHPKDILSVLLGVDFLQVFSVEDGFVVNNILDSSVEVLRLIDARQVVVGCHH